MPRPGTALGPSSAEVEEQYMHRALELAERGRGRVSPNPMVGCVLVNDGRIVGEGWHQRAGEAHAEVNALKGAGSAAAGATAYVTLEPCDHTGRTPPCTEALIAAGVARVIIAAGDPDPRVNGGGLARLREAGIEVVTGVLENEAHHQNEIFRTNKLLGRPFVLYKTAMSLDGKVATAGGPARWITGEQARARVHVWRDELDAIAVGVGTVLQDDPSLTTRLAGAAPGRTPIKVLFDGRLRTPPGARLFEAGPDGQPARVIIVAARAAAGDPDATPRMAALRERGAEILLTEDEGGRPLPAAALPALQERGVTSLLLEGGGSLAWSFLAAGLIDRVAWFVAPTLIGGAGVPTPLAGAGAASMAEAVHLGDVRSELVGRDLLVTGRPQPNAQPNAQPNMQPNVEDRSEN